MTPHSYSVMITNDITLCKLYEFLTPLSYASLIHDILIQIRSIELVNLSTYKYK